MSFDNMQREKGAKTITVVLSLSFVVTNGLKTD